MCIIWAVRGARVDSCLSQWLLIPPPPSLSSSPPPPPVWRLELFLSQINFMVYIAVPILSAAARLFPTFRDMFEAGLDENKRYPGLTRLQSCPRLCHRVLLVFLQEILVPQ
jgi:hypothetical protein